MKYKEYLSPFTSFLLVIFGIMSSYFGLPFIFTIVVPTIIFSIVFASIAAVDLLRYMVLYLFAVNVSLLTKNPFIDYTLIAISVVYFYFIYRKNKFSFASLQFSIKKVFYLVAIGMLLAFLILLYLSDMRAFRIFILGDLGYDQVGHFAIIRTLNSCVEMLFQCDPQSSLLPRNYMFYPQQWHVLFSRFINSDTIESSVQSFIVVILISVLLSLYLTTNSLRQIFSKLNLQMPLHSPIWIGDLVVLISGTFIVILSFMGYPNFVFSISLFLSGISLLIAGEVKQTLLATIVLMLSVASYTLLLVPSALICLYYASFRLRSFPLKLVIFVFIVFSIISILFISSLQSHLDYLYIGGGGLNPYIVIIEIAGLVSVGLSFFRLFRGDYVDKKSYVDLLVFNFIIVASLFALQGLTFFSGKFSSYYLGKFSYFSIFSILITLYICLDRWTFRWDFLRNHRTLFYLFLALWFILPRIPFNSPVNTLYQIVRPSNFGELRKVEAIYRAAISSKSSLKPAVFLSNETGSDTQIVNALSGFWSAELNDYLENDIDNEVELRDPDFQSLHGNTFLFVEFGND